jgi:hypothetical protein
VRRKRFECVHHSFGSDESGRNKGEEADVCPDVLEDVASSDNRGKRLLDLRFVDPEAIGDLAASAIDSQPTREAFWIRTSLLRMVRPRRLSRRLARGFE